MNEKVEKNLTLSLFLMRISIFLVMLMWTLDKFVNPVHTTKVFEHFYFLPGMGSQALAIIAGIQLLVVILFVVGFKKKYTYGLILFMHLVSTLSSYKQYLNPWKSLLFFAAWPMLAACLALFLLRDFDTFLSLKEGNNE